MKYLANSTTNNTYIQEKCVFSSLVGKVLAYFRVIRSPGSFYVHVLIIRIWQIFQLYIPQGNIFLFYLQRHLGLWLFFSFSSENIHFSTTTFIQEIRWNLDVFNFLTAFTAVIYWEERVTCNSWFSQWQQEDACWFISFFSFVYFSLPHLDMYVMGSSTATKIRFALTLYWQG